MTRRMREAATTEAITTLSIEKADRDQVSLPQSHIENTTHPQASCRCQSCKLVGVRTWLARAYFITGDVSQRGGGQALAFRVGHCWTWSLVDIRLGPVETRRGPTETCRGPYLSRTPIRVHRVFRQGSSGAVGPYRLKSGFRWVSVRILIWHDRHRRDLSDHATVSYR